MLELLLVFSIVCLVYFIKIYYVIKNKVDLKKNKRVENIFLLASRHELVLTKSIIKFLKGFDFDLALFNASNLSHAVKNQIIQEVLLPKARKYARSRNLVKKVLATEYFQLGMEKQDEIVMIKLLKDPILLVSQNAVLAAFKTSSKLLINMVIDLEVEKSRFYQSVNLGQLAGASKDLGRIIIERLAKESNPKVLAFGFLILAHLPVELDALTIAEQHLKSHNIELILNILNYLAHVKTQKTIQIIRNYLIAKQWEVRTRAVQLLGKLKDNASIDAMASMLRDQEWWVRHRAAEALGNLGAEGILKLEAQNPNVDRYAYEAAVQVLRSLEAKKISQEGN